VISGATASVSNNATLTMDVGYDVTKHVSAMLMLGIPPKATVTGEGTLKPYGSLGSVRYGPSIFTTTYNFRQQHLLRPYFGGGVAYAIIFKEYDAAVTDLTVHNNWGSVVQGGVELPIDKHFTCFVDFKKVWLSVNAHGLLSGETPAVAHIQLNPPLVSVGFKYQLGHRPR
jgi:outer membrane protein